jgi:hypothetical protein
VPKLLSRNGGLRFILLGTYFLTAGVILHCFFMGSAFGNELRSVYAGVLVCSLLLAGFLTFLGGVFVILGDRLGLFGPEARVE